MCQSDYVTTSVPLADTMILTAQKTFEAGEWVDDVVHGRPHTTANPA